MILEARPFCSDEEIELIGALPFKEFFDFYFVFLPSYFFLLLPLFLKTKYIIPNKNTNKTTLPITIKIIVLLCCFSVLAAIVDRGNAN